MTFRLPLVVGTILLAGCASQQPSGLSDTKSQADTKNRDRDLYECQREATFADVGKRQQVFDNCMKARGYTQK
jgi:outer membrane receptor for monomeric catechols